MRVASGLVAFHTWDIRGARRGHTSVPGLPYILVYQVRHDDELVIVMGVFDGAQDR